MTRNHQIFMLSLVGDGCLNRVSTTLSRHAMHAFQSDRKRRATEQSSQTAVLFRDQRNTQLSNPFIGQCHVDNSSTVVQHVIDDLGGHFFRRNAKETVAVGPFLVYKDHHPTFAEFLDTLLNGCERHIQSRMQNNLKTEANSAL